MNAIKNNREEAMKWWNALTTQEKIFIADKLAPYRYALSLTGREIEKIWMALFGNPSNTTDNG